MASQDFYVAMHPVPWLIPWKRRSLDPNLHAARKWIKSSAVSRMKKQQEELGPGLSILSSCLRCFCRSTESPTPTQKKASQQK
uniref:Uncharacterized protein n=1 Tax=Physcomitrium patens TaxID=3218 RepID=A0A2K1IQ77_PHYPA|nr:hypothetical protein PHYPA_025557 [Physcomitrium patens]